MSEPRHPSPGGHRAARRRVLLIAGLLPVLIALGTVILITSWVPELPDPVAIHWSGASDTPDGFGSVGMIRIALLAGIIGFAVIAVVVAWRLTPLARLGATQKVMTVAAVWLAAFLSVTIGGSLWIQRGLDDAADAGPVLPWLGIGLLAGVLAAAAVWPLLPAVDRSPLSTPVTVSARAAGGRREWHAVARMDTGALVVATIVLVGLAVVLIVAGTAGGDGTWVGAGVLAVVSLVGSSMSIWRVRVDERGLAVASLLGWPRTRIAPGEIRAVRVVEVDPLREFGGWGWRMDALGRSGVVVRRGPAIEVERPSGRRFVVTVADAATGAAVLAAIAGDHRRIR